MEYISDVAEGLVECHKRTVQVIGDFLDRLSVEGATNPGLQTAHLGMIEAIHSFKRSRKALEDYEKKVNL